MRFFCSRKGVNVTRMAILSKAPALKFSNRLGIAAGFDKNAEVVGALSHLGFGFIEVGTVTPLPQMGNHKPRLWRVPPSSLVNAMGFNNCGLVEFRRHLQSFRHMASCPVFANIGKGRATKNDDAIIDYANSIKSLIDVVDGFVINVSSPNTEGLRDLQNTSFLNRLEQNIPEGVLVFIKLAPDLTNESLSMLFDFIKDSRRISGLVLTNTSLTLASRFQGLRGGLSGPPLLERSLETVAMARHQIGNEKHIIGVGGVSDRASFLAMREAGADLVEVYTAFTYRGPNLIKEIGDAAKI